MLPEPAEYDRWLAITLEEEIASMRWCLKGCILRERRIVRELNSKLVRPVAWPLMSSTMEEVSQLHKIQWHQAQLDGLRKRLKNIVKEVREYRRLRIEKGVHLPIDREWQEFLKEINREEQQQLRKLQLQRNYEKIISHQGNNAESHR